MAIKKWLYIFALFSTNIWTRENDVYEDEIVDFDIDNEAEKNSSSIYKNDKNENKKSIKEEAPKVIKNNISNPENKILVDNNKSINNKKIDFDKKNLGKNLGIIGGAGGLSFTLTSVVKPKNKNPSIKDQDNSSNVITQQKPLKMNKNFIETQEIKSTVNKLMKDKENTTIFHKLPTKSKKKAFKNQLFNTEIINSNNIGNNNLFNQNFNNTQSIRLKNELGDSQILEISYNEMQDNTSNEINALKTELNKNVKFQQWIIKDNNDEFVQEILKNKVNRETLWSMINHSIYKQFNPDEKLYDIIKESYFENPNDPLNINMIIAKYTSYKLLMGFFNKNNFNNSVPDPIINQTQSTINKTLNMTTSQDHSHNNTINQIITGFNHNDNKNKENLSVISESSNEPSNSDETDDENIYQDNRIIKEPMGQSFSFNQVNSNNVIKTLNQYNYQNISQEKTFHEINDPNTIIKENNISKISNMSNIKKRSRSKSLNINDNIILDMNNIHYFSLNESLPDNITEKRQYLNSIPQDKNNLIVLEDNINSIINNKNFIDNSVNDEKIINDKINENNGNIQKNSQNHKIILDEENFIVQNEIKDHNNISHENINNDNSIIQKTINNESWEVNMSSSLNSSEDDIKIKNDNYFSVYNILMEGLLDKYGDIQKQNKVLEVFNNGVFFNKIDELGENPGDNILLREIVKSEEIISEKKSSSIEFVSMEDDNSSLVIRDNNYNLLKNNDIIMDDNKENHLEENNILINNNLDNNIKHKEKILEDEAIIKPIDTSLKSLEPSVQESYISIAQEDSYNEQEKIITKDDLFNNDKLKQILNIESIINNSINHPVYKTKIDDAIKKYRLIIEKYNNDGYNSNSHLIDSKEIDYKNPQYLNFIRFLQYITNIATSNFQDSSYKFHMVLMRTFEFLSINTKQNLKIFYNNLNKNNSSNKSNFNFAFYRTNFMNAITSIIDLFQLIENNYHHESIEIHNPLNKTVAYFISMVLIYKNPNIKYEEDNILLKKSSDHIINYLLNFSKESIQDLNLLKEIETWWINIITKDTEAFKYDIKKFFNNLNENLLTLLVSYCINSIDKTIDSSKPMETLMGQVNEYNNSFDLNVNNFHKNLIIVRDYFAHIDHQLPLKKENKINNKKDIRSTSQTKSMIKLNNDSHNFSKVNIVEKVNENIIINNRNISAPQRNHSNSVQLMENNRNTLESSSNNNKKSFINRFSQRFNNTLSNMLRGKSEKTRKEDFKPMLNHLQELQEEQSHSEGKSPSPVNDVLKNQKNNFHREITPPRSLNSGNNNSSERQKIISPFNQVKHLDDMDDGSSINEFRVKFNNMMNNKKVLHENIVQDNNIELINGPFNNHLAIYNLQQKTADISLINPNETLNGDNTLKTGIYNANITLEPSSDEEKKSQ